MFGEPSSCKLVICSVIFSSSVVQFAVIAGGVSCYTGTVTLGFIGSTGRAGYTGTVTLGFIGSGIIGSITGKGLITS